MVVVVGAAVGRHGMAARSARTTSHHAPFIVRTPLISANWHMV